MLTGLATFLNDVKYLCAGGQGGATRYRFRTSISGEKDAWIFAQNGPLF